MKTIRGYEPFEFQKDAINNLLEIVKHNNGACIFDETGLGKTITAATTAINLTKGKIAVIAPKSNHKNWKEVLNRTGTSFEVYTFAKPPESSCEVLILDEGHNLRNYKSKSFIKVFETVKKFNPIVLILTATPFQNSTREFRDVISLINFKSDTPAFVMLGHYFDSIIEAEKKIHYIDRYSDDGMSFGQVTERSKHSVIQEEYVKGVAKVLSTFSIRNTRSKILEKYYSDVELMGHFPKIQKENIETFFSPDEILIIGNIIEVLHKMKFAIQNAASYSNHPRYKTNQSFVGLMKTFLLKRLDSSVHAFKKSVEKMLFNVNTELLKGTYSIEIEGNNYPLSDSYLIDLGSDVRSFEKIIELSKELNDNKKLETLLTVIGQEKSIVFTEFKDTLEIIKEFLTNNYNDKFVCYTSESNESLLDSITASFDANYEDNTLFKEDIKVLVATDVLSEGVNLHAANKLVHFDQKWNPSKITQRNGRIDRILKSGINKKIIIYHFQVDNVIEGIIELDKKITTKQGLGEKYLQEETLVLQKLEEFQLNTTLFYETAEADKGYYQCYKTYLGEVLAEEKGYFGEKVVFSLEEVKIPKVEVQLEKYYSPNSRRSSLYYCFHPEFNLLYRDAWAELAKIYSKDKGAISPVNIPFLSEIEREEPETCALWLHKRKYLKN